MNRDNVSRKRACLASCIRIKYGERRRRKRLHLHLVDHHDPDKSSGTGTWAA